MINVDEQTDHAGGFAALGLRPELLTALEELGYEVTGEWGSLADREEQIGRVERQEPDAKTTLPPGEAVTIWIFKKPPAKAPKK